MKNSIVSPKGGNLGDLNNISRFLFLSSFLETFVFRYLLNHANTHSNVVHALCSVVGRIVKVSYLTDLRQRKLLSELGEFFSGNLFCQKLGFEILTEVVTQISHFSSCIVFFFIINIALETHSTFRSTAIVFCDTMLLPILKQTLSFVPTSTPFPQLTPEYIVFYSSLFRLFNVILQFDFSGSRNECLADEVEMLIIPSDWSPFVTSSSLLSFLYYLYTNGDDSLAAIAAESVLYLTSMRRSIFNSPTEAVGFYEEILRALNLIIKQQVHLQDDTCHLLVCQILSKLKLNIQFNEIIKFADFPEFFQTVSQFAKSTLEQHGYFGNFLYILIFWARIVESLRFTNAPIQDYYPLEKLERDITNVVHAFVFTFPEHVDDLVNDSLNSPLFNMDKFMKDEERLGIILNYNSGLVKEWILQLATPRWPAHDMRDYCRIENG